MEGVTLPVQYTMQERETVIGYCNGCETIIALLAMSNNLKACFEGALHRSDACIYVTLCRACEVNAKNIGGNVAKPGQFIQKKVINSFKWKVECAVSGSIRTCGTKKKALVVHRHDLFSYSHDKVQLSQVTGSRVFPLNRVVRGDFF